MNDDPYLPDQIPQPIKVPMRELLLAVVLLGTSLPFVVPTLVCGFSMIHFQGQYSTYPDPNKISGEAFRLGLFLTPFALLGVTLFVDGFRRLFK